MSVTEADDYARWSDRYLDAPQRVPWNKGKPTGVNPLRPKHVWSIRTKLQIEGRLRDLAMFSMASDSKFGCCDIVALRVEGVAAGGHTADRFELRERTRQAIDAHPKAANKRPHASYSRVTVVPKPDDDPSICVLRFGVELERWALPEAVRDAFVATHKATLIYRRTGTLRYPAIVELVDV
jgi:hypothetical protein